MRRSWPQHDQRESLPLRRQRNNMAMMMLRISPEYLMAATRCSPAIAQTYAPVLHAAAERWAIDTPLRRSAWIAQLAHESSLFTRTKESLYYTTPARLVAVWPSRFRMPANTKEARLDKLPGGKRNPNFYVRDEAKLAEFVYSDRMGNGPEGFGDGAKYIGRGLIMLTGQAGYAAYQRASGYPVLEHPALLSEPLAAADSAGWYWSSNSLSNYADLRNFEGLGRRINGGSVGMTERLALTTAALRAAGVA